MSRYPSHPDRLNTEADHRADYRALPESDLYYDDLEPEPWEVADLERDDW